MCQTKVVALEHGQPCCHIKFYVMVKELVVASNRRRASGHLCHRRCHRPSWGQDVPELGEGGLAGERVRHMLASRLRPFQRSKGGGFSEGARGYVAAYQKEGGVVAFIDKQESNYMLTHWHQSYYVALLSYAGNMSIADNQSS